VHIDARLGMGKINVPKGPQTQKATQTRGQGVKGQYQPTCGKASLGENTVRLTALKVSEEKQDRLHSIVLGP
jgi:hypothetical protein